MAPKPFFNLEDADRIEAMLRSGMSQRAIALHFGCDHMTVTKFVHRYLPDWQAPERPLMRILFIDIETRPGLAYYWDVHEQWIPPARIIEEPSTFAFAAKWLGDGGVEFRSTFHDGRQKMVQRAHELLSEADAVVTYNGNRFDLPHLNMEFLRDNYKPPAPYKSVDLLPTIRRKFKFSSRKLENVSQRLGIGQKVEHEGFALWDKCVHDDPEAWGRMREYNMQDVRLTEDLYRTILPWIEQHPSFAALLNDQVCVNCGSPDLSRHGYYYTKTGAYPKYQCDACGKWQRGTHRDFGAEITETAMS